METSRKLHFTERRGWRAWLRTNHRRERDVWLVFHKKHTGKPVLAYDDAVEEAICWGWIDTTVKRIDEERYVRRFTPRLPGSSWSDLNRRRARHMVETGRMTRAGREALEGVDLEAPAAPARRAAPCTPRDLQSELAASPGMLARFKSFPPSCRRAYIEWIQAARREETRLRRIRRTVEMVEQDNRRPML